MIRFIEVGNQVLDDEKYFSWWDTITDRYLEFNGEQMWETWFDLTSDMFDDYRSRESISSSSQIGLGTRLWRLYPGYRKGREGYGDGKVYGWVD